MSGGALEYVMGNMVSIDGTTMMSGTDSEHYNSGFTGIVYEDGTYINYSGVESPEDKYYDKYSFSETETITRGKLGDSSREVYTWYDLGIYVVRAYYPWMYRGGLYDGKYAPGVFALNGNGGTPHTSLSTRFVITN